MFKKNSNEREELYFVLKSENVNIEICMFAKYTLKYV